MTQPPTTIGRKPRELTGRAVLFCLLGFFGVVGAANVVLVREATSTFGGVEHKNAYSAGLAFNREIAAARTQEARHWAVDAKLTPVRHGDAGLAVTVRDRNGAPPPALSLVARLAHPADTRRDRQIAVHQIAPGTFRGSIQAAPGQWDLVIEFSRNDERLFRSKSRVILR